MSRPDLVLLHHYDDDDEEEDDGDDGDDGDGGRREGDAGHEQEAEAHGSSVPTFEEGGGSCGGRQTRAAPFIAYSCYDDYCDDYQCQWRVVDYC